MDGYFFGSMIANIYDDAPSSTVTCQDIEYAASMGMDTIRFQIIQGVGLPKYQPYPEYINFVYWKLDLLDRCKEVIQKYNMKVILVMMHPYGGYEKGKAQLFRKPELYIAKFIDCWKYIAERYKDTDINLTYELINEPYATSTKEYLAYMQNVVDEIRSIDKNKIIIIPCPNVSPKNFENMKPLKGENLYYSFHFYVDSKLTHYGINKERNRTYTGTTKDVEKQIQHVLAFVRKYQKPVLCTEFGHTHFNKKNQFNWVGNVLKVFKKFGFSWIYNGVGQGLINPKDGSEINNVFKLNKDTDLLIRAVLTNK